MEKKTKSFNVYKILYFGVLFIALSLAVSFYVYRDNTVIDIEFLKGELGTKDKIIEELQNELKTKSLELEKTKLKEKQNSNTKLLKEDIYLYISAEYQKIPKSVARTISDEIVDNSNELDVAPEITLGIIEVESSFNPTVTGPKTKYGHARGLMQVMPEWVKKFDFISDIYDLYDIDSNIRSGIKVFKIHLDEGKGDISKGLYYYVNNDKEYVNRVFSSIGKFISFRSTDKKGKSKSNGINQGAEEGKK